MSTAARSRSPVGDGAVWVATDDAGRCGGWRRLGRDPYRADHRLRGRLRLHLRSFAWPAPSFRCCDRGARLAGPRPADGITEATVAGKEVRLFLGLRRPDRPRPRSRKTRRLVEQVGVDVLIGPNYIGEGLAIKEYARAWPDVTFVANLAGAGADTPEAGRRTSSDSHPTARRSWPGSAPTPTVTWAGARAVTIADDQSFDYTQVAGFVAEFCALGGRSSSRSGYRRPSRRRRRTTRGLPQRNVDGYLAAGFIINDARVRQRGSGREGQPGGQGRRWNPLGQPRV